MDFKEILKHFRLNGDVQDVKNFGSGHINETYLVKTTSNTYILQNLNTEVFKNFYGVMDNIAKVTSFIKERAKNKAKCLYLIKTTDNSNYYYEDGYCYRMMNFISS